MTWNGLKTYYERRREEGSTGIVRDHQTRKIVAKSHPYKVEVDRRQDLDLLRRKVVRAMSTIDLGQVRPATPPSQETPPNITEHKKKK